mmetsp:Transcript_47974/g.104617  ORF Transcript_47974/g.104617 Transcript_47974/m.104617 type:complete len:200 (-) Transcript_47974:1760-2359(-)
MGAGGAFAHGGTDSDGADVCRGELPGHFADDLRQLSGEPGQCPAASAGVWLLHGPLRLVVFRPHHPVPAASVGDSIQEEAEEGGNRGGCCGSAPRLSSTGGPASSAEEAEALCQVDPLLHRGSCKAGGLLSWRGSGCQLLDARALCTRHCLGHRGRHWCAPGLSGQSQPGAVSNLRGAIHRCATSGCKGVTAIARGKGL